MNASYRAINYGLRPAKCVERKMLAEAFRKLSVFDHLENYWYIGFGSTYFSDFYLFHKLLNITKMDSIEKDSGNKERFEFNRPYKCIKIHFRDSSFVLPTLNWESSRTIVWLDYDGLLTDSVLEDINTVFGSAISGSIIVVSMNADPTQPPEDRLDSLGNRIGKNRIPVGTRKNDFSKWGTAKIYREIINNEILETLVNRNGGSSQSDEMMYHQLFNFHYEDGAKMLTVGGIINSVNESNLYQACNFEQMNFIRENEEPYLIRIPNLTYREIRHLDRLLPITSQLSKTLPHVPEIDIEDYSKIYRYYPTFAEAEL
jgi:hypothetical protein